MPIGLKRFQQAEAIHFITFSCFHRLPYLQAPEPKTKLEAILEQARARHQARIYAYVFMPEHVHILINEPPAILLSQFLKSFKQTSSRHLKGDHDQFWQTRYFDRNIRGDEARSEVIHYIHQNPVQRGLVQHPCHYRWSSFTHYATGLPGPIEIESDHTARTRAHQFQPTPP